MRKNNEGKGYGEWGCGGTRGGYFRWDGLGKTGLRRWHLSSDLMEVREQPWGIFQAGRGASRRALSWERTWYVREMARKLGLPEWNKWGESSRRGQQGSGGPGGVKPCRPRGLRRLRGLMWFDIPQLFLPAEPRRGRSWVWAVPGRPQATAHQPRLLLCAWAPSSFGLGQLAKRSGRQDDHETFIICLFSGSISKTDGLCPGGLSDVGGLWESVRMCVCACVRSPWAILERSAFP